MHRQGSGAQWGQPDVKPYSPRRGGSMQVRHGSSATAGLLSRSCILVPVCLSLQWHVGFCIMSWVRTKTPAFESVILARSHVAVRRGAAHNHKTCEMHGLVKGVVHAGMRRLAACTRKFQSGQGADTQQDRIGNHSRR